MRLIDADALRKAVNDFYDNHFNGLVPNELITYAEAVDNAINNAPKVELNDKSLEIARKSIELGRNVGKLEGKLERPQGEWIDTASGYKCSVCGEENDYAYDEYKHKFTDYFCPNCGSDMRQEETKDDG